MVHLFGGVFEMLAQPAFVHMMGQSARMNLCPVHLVHVVLSQSNGSRIGYDGWNSVKYNHIIIVY